MGGLGILNRCCVLFYLGRAVDFGEDDRARAAAAGDFEVRQETLAMAAPRRVMQHDEGLVELGEEGGPAAGGQDLDCAFFFDVVD